MILASWLDKFHNIVDMVHMCAMLVKCGFDDMLIVVKSEMICCCCCFFLFSPDGNNWVSSDYIQSSQYGILRLGNFGKKKPKRNAFG